jgi:hypothetical protein
MRFWSRAQLLSVSLRFILAKICVLPLYSYGKLFSIQTSATHMA